jgi:hypothetical protein
VTINPPPSLSFPPPPPGTVDVPYSHQLTVTGGTAPFGWAISAGTLPPGLSLNPATGLLSGTPSTAGAFDFTVQVTDASALTATRPVTLTILAGLLISVPSQVDLGTVSIEAGSATGQLGAVTVTDDRGSGSGSWVTTVSITDFTTGAGSTGETIPNDAVSYSSGPATQTTGNGTFFPQIGVSLAVPQIAARWSGEASGNSTTWNPTLTVTFPPTLVTGTYRATITHSVA